MQHAEFRIGKSTVQKVIHETTRAIFKALQPIVMKFPIAEDWKKIGKDFEATWQFPHCIGAIDGRHVRIKAPPLTGSQFYNYKGFFSMVLVGNCDAYYKFTWVDIGQYGSISDGGMWSNTDLCQDLEDKVLQLPEPAPLQGLQMPFTYVFVGDEAFPLTSYMMRPYPRKDLADDKRIFNYRLSRARRTIENTFGILCARWKILNQPLSMKAENLEALFQALVVLHNFIMIGEEKKEARERQYAPPEFIDNEEEDGSITEGQWREHVSPYFERIGRVGGNRASNTANGMRNYLKDFINSDSGYQQCPWQAAYAFRGHDLNMER